MKLLPDVWMGQRRSRQIAEQSDFAVLHEKPADDLNTAENDEVIELRHEPAALSLRHKLGFVHSLAGRAAQARHGLIETDLASRQGHDRLQVEIDTICVDGVADGLERDFVHHRNGWLRGAIVRGAAWCWRRHGTSYRGLLGSRAGHCIERRLVHPDHFGKSSDARIELAHLDVQWVGDGASLVEHRFEFAVQGREPAPHLRNLTPDIGPTAGEICELPAHCGSQAETAGNRVVKPKESQDGDGHCRGLQHPEIEIQTDGRAGETRNYQHA